MTLYQISLFIPVIISTVFCGPVSVFVKKAPDNTSNLSNPQDPVIPQDPAMPLPGYQSSENKSSGLSENNIQRLEGARRSVSKFVSNTCHTLLKEEEQKCLCEKQNVSIYDNIEMVSKKENNNGIFHYGSELTQPAP